jgi:hypothetical protein
MTIDKPSLIRIQQLAYWTAFKKFMDSKKSPIKCSHVLPQFWVDMRIGLSGFWLSAKVSSLKPIISVDFRFKTQTSKAIYFAFFSDKEAIETEFGTALEWNELPDGKESFINVTKDKADFRNEQDWQNQFTWLADSLEKMDSVFRNRVLNLDIN